MLNFIVKHSRYGIGKIVAVDNRTAKVRFVTGDELVFSQTSFNDGSIYHVKLRPKFRCNSERGKCIIQKSLNENQSRNPIDYEVLFDDGLSAVVSELELIPLPQEKSNEPHELLSNLETQTYKLFCARENLQNAYAGLIREGRSLRALLSSRIDLRPHQAYVAGVVLLDNVRRYLLADEVGLGKTIEAGIIIHDVLAVNPNARILVLCPSSLTQQWFCEMYSKFSGQIFTFLDLHAGKQINPKGLGKTISSIVHAAYDRSDLIHSVPWDLVVIDEAHHLLASKVLYEFAERLSLQSRSFLLLSAIPATRREDEFLRLLKLLEPKRYRSFSEEARQSFQRLYNAQSQIGRLLRLASRRVENEDNTFTPNDVIKIFDKMLEIDILAEDEKFSDAVSTLNIESDDFTDQARNIIRDLADRFRINRRILRNRRQRLIEEGQIVPIQRMFQPHEYEPEQLEIETIQSIEEIIHSIIRKKAIARDKEKEELSFLIPAIFRILQQSLVFPQTVRIFLERLNRTLSYNLNDKGRDFIKMSHIFGYEDWDDMASLLCIGARKYIPLETLERAIYRTKSWEDSGNSFTRYKRLTQFLSNRHEEDPQAKFIVFSGFPNSAEILTEMLQDEFGYESVKDFLFNSLPEEKEKNILEFQKNEEVWILVSDETGGEGRNFQFADELIHFDNPWFASRVEQRIGRLDRLGREKYGDKVVSNVFYPAGTLEAALVQCYQDGLKMFERSVSGLEFALRDTEEKIVEIAVESGFDGMINFIPELADIAERERAVDESEAVLDEASYELQAAQKYLQISHQADNETKLQKSFVQYFKMLSTPWAAKEISDPYFPNGVWKFKLDELQSGKLLVRNEHGGALTEIKGTFNREIAQQSLSLNFFNVGNQFFDAVINSLYQTTTGRVYGVVCRSNKIQSWRGLEFSFFAEPDLSLLSGSPALINKAAGLFPLKPVNVFLTLNGKWDIEESKTLRKIRRDLHPAQKDKTWCNLTKDKTKYLPQLVGDRDWEDLVYKLHEKALNMAHKHFDKKLKPIIEAEVARCTEQLRQMDLLSGEFAIEGASLQLLCEALNNWKIKTDTAGFLAVNVPGFNLNE